MAAAVFIARRELRRRVGAFVFLAVLVGLIGGLALSLIAGSRRSASVVDRYFAAGIPYDVQMYAPDLSAEQVRSIEGVERADLDAYIGGATVDEHGNFVGGVNLVAVATESYDPTIEVLDGRMPDRSDVLQAAVNESFVQAYRAGVGDTVMVALFAPDQGDDLDAGDYTNPRGPRLPMVITGVFRSPFDIAVDEVSAPGRTAAVVSNSMIVPSEFYEMYRSEFVDFGAGYDIQLAPSMSVADLMEAVDELSPDDAQPAMYGPARFSERRSTLDTPVGVETSALLLLGLGAAFAGGVAVALLMRAEQRGHDGDAPALRALGTSDMQLRSIAVLRTFPVAFVGAALAVVVSIALSGRFPVGVGRQVELDRGMEVNVTVLALGAAGIIVAVAGLAFLMGGPRRGRPRKPRDSTVASWLRRAGARPDVTIGTHFAFERTRGARSSPTRAAVVGGAAAIASVVALALMVSGISRIYSEPAEHGWPWDIVVGNINFEFTPAEISDLTNDPRFAASSTGRSGAATVAGEDVELLAIDPHGSAPPEVLDGRVPETANEIALGDRFMRRLGVEIGDTVTLSVAGTEFESEVAEPTDVDLVVVGVAVAPVLGESDIGEGGIVTLEGIAAAGGFAQPNLVLAKFHEGADADAVAASIEADAPSETMTDTVPGRVASLYRVRVLPLLGLAFAGLLGTVVLAFVLASSGRLRTRELAVLRVLGLRGRRLGAILAWQGVALATATLVFGLPLGIAAGAVLWRNLAGDLGVDASLVVTPVLLLLIPGAIGVAVLASLQPARRARRQPVATLLNGE